MCLCAACAKLCSLACRRPFSLQTLTQIKTSITARLNSSIPFLDLLPFFVSKTLHIELQQNPEANARPDIRLGELNCKINVCSVLPLESQPTSFIFLDAVFPTSKFPDGT